MRFFYVFRYTISILSGHWRNAVASICTSAEGTMIFSSSLQVWNAQDPMAFRFVPNSISFRA